jgi:hypothetical protein
VIIPDCANSVLQILYEVWKFKKINLVHGSFIVTASGNRYTMFLVGFNEFSEKFSSDRVVQWQQLCLLNRWFVVRISVLLCIDR